MHWELACFKSPAGITVRIDSSRRRVFRYKDGTASRRVKGYIEQLSQDKVDGFDDWYPLNYKED